MYVLIDSTQRAVLPVQVLSLKRGSISDALTVTPGTMSFSASLFSREDPTALSLTFLHVAFN